MEKGYDSGRSSSREIQGGSEFEGRRKSIEKDGKPELIDLGAKEEVVLKPNSHDILSLSASKNFPSDEEIRTGVCRRKSIISCPKYQQDYMRLLDGNREYANEKREIDENYFINLSKTQTPKYLLIGCSDSRVPPNEMTKTDPGEIFIHRNIANQVIFSDINCMSVIQYAVEYLKVEHIIVMGHTKCGGIIAASTSKNFKGLIENWLQNIKDIAISHKNELDTLKNKEDFIRKLTILNIKSQVLNVCKTPFVQKAWAEGKDIHVHGWLMDIETGLIEDLGVTNRDWDEIKEFYGFQF